VTLDFCQTLVHKETGFLFSDEIDFQHKAQILLHDKSTRTLMGKNGHLFAQNFSWLSLAKEQETYYKKVADLAKCHQ
jgi:glycosyltransferase involved in cell wall biosynthesis